MAGRMVKLERLVLFAAGAGLLYTAFVVSERHYLLFHTLAEFASIAIALCIFMIAWNSRRFFASSFYPVLGTGMLCIGALDLLHTLAYQGMGVFSGNYESDLASQLWIAARYTQAVSFILAAMYIRRRIRSQWLLAGYGVWFAAIVASIFYWRVFPVTFDWETGLTPLKNISEYIVIAMFGGSLWLIWRKRNFFDGDVFRYLAAAIVISMVSEFAFTRYTSVFGLANAMGHVLKIAAFYCIYKALIATGLQRPYDLIFRELTESRENLKQMKNQLEDIVRQRTADLAQTVSILQEEVADRLEAQRRLEESEAHVRKLNTELEQRVAQRTAELEAIIRYAPQGIVVVDDNHRIRMVNPAAQSFYRGNLGLFNEQEWEEAIFRRVDGTAIEPEDLPLRRSVSLGETHQNVEMVIERKNQQSRRILVNTAPIRNQSDGVAGAISIFHDVTELRRSEQAIKQNEQRLRLAIQDSPAMLFSQDTGLRYSWIYNDKIYPLDIAVGKTDHEVCCGEELIDIKNRVIATGRAKQMEICHCCNENTYYFKYAIEPVRDRTGRVTGITGAAIDVTDVRMSEQKLLKLTEELRRSNRDLEQFAYVASHDLQEPLRMISGYLQLLERRYKGTLDQDATDFIGYAVDGSNRMQRLIDDLLSYSRMGRRDKPFRMTDFNDIARQVIADLSFSIKENNASIVVKPLPKILADPQQIYHVLQNLLTNAIRFKSDRPLEVLIQAQARDKEWLFSVRDNGIGIEPEYTDRIFVIFQRLHSQRTHKGTGMGLAICKKIVESHGGDIWVESQPGAGSTFFFTIGQENVNVH